MTFLSDKTGSQDGQPGAASRAGQSSTHWALSQPQQKAAEHQALHQAEGVKPQRLNI